MNLFAQSVTAGLLILAITACQNDTHLPEPTETSSARQATAGDIMVGTGKKYTLLTEGTTTLTYSGQEIPMMVSFSPTSYRLHGINSMSNTISFSDHEVLWGCPK